MMREIKFRVWDARFEKYLDPQKIVIRCNGEIAGIYGGKGTVKDWVAEQFTGLKDKNGKEVFEGDVLKMSDGVDAKTYKVKSYMYLEVYYNMRYFCYALRDKDTIKRDVDFLLFNGVCDFEVIGNIHDNPELLEAT